MTAFLEQFTSGSGGMFSPARAFGAAFERTDASIRNPSLHPEEDEMSRFYGPVFAAGIRFGQEMANEAGGGY